MSVVVTSKPHTGYWCVRDTRREDFICNVRSPVFNMNSFYMVNLVCMVIGSRTQQFSSLSCWKQQFWSIFADLKHHATTSK